MSTTTSFVSLRIEQSSSRLNVEPFLLHLTAFAKLDIVLGDLLEVDVAERRIVRK
jgi:hypothetical protein